MTVLANLEVAMKLRNEKFQAAMKSSTASGIKFTQKTQKGLDAVSKKTDIFANKILNLRNVFAAAGVGLFAKQLVDLGLAFDESIASLGAITGAVGKDLDFLKDKALEFGRTTTLGASDAAKGFELMASAMPKLLSDLPALAKVTKDAITLGEAAGITVAESAQVLGGALNQYGLGAESAARFINVLAAGSKLGSSQVRDTAAALSDAGTIAAQAGVGFEELNGSIQTLAANSIKGGKAGTALRNIITTLEASTDKKLKPSIHGLTKVMQTLKSRGFDNSTHAAELFGREGVAASLVLMKNTELTKKLTAAMTGTAIAQEQAKVKSESFSGRVKALNSAIEGLGLALFDQLKPGLKAATEGMTSFISAITENIDKISMLVPLVAAGGALIVGLVLVGATLKAVSIAAGLTAAALTLVSAHPVIAALAAMALGVAFLATKFDVVMDALKAFAEAANNMSSFVAAVMEYVGEIFAVTFHNIKVAAMNTFKNLKDAVGSIKGAFNTMRDNLAPIVDAMMSKLQPLIDKFLELKKSITDTEAYNSAQTVLLDAIDFSGFNQYDPNAVGSTANGIAQSGIMDYRQQMDVRIIVDDQGIIKAIVDNQEFKGGVAQEVNTITKDAARTTRR